MKKKLTHGFWYHATALSSPAFYILLVVSFILVSVAFAQDFEEIIALFSAVWSW